MRVEGPQRAVIETIAVDPRPDPQGRRLLGVAEPARDGPRPDGEGEAPVREGEGHRGQGGRPVRVKVSGVLKAEGVVAGNFIKDGTYTVTGEQTYDPQTREWTSSRWSVVVNNELANPAGLTVAQAGGR